MAYPEHYYTPSLVSASGSRRNSPPSDPPTPGILSPTGPPQGGMWGSNGAPHVPEWYKSPRGAANGGMTSPLGMGHPGGQRRPPSPPSSSHQPSTPPPLASSSSTESIMPPASSTSTSSSTRSSLIQAHTQLGDVNSNQMPTLGLASPFVPSDPNCLWGPPMGMQSPEQRSVSLEKELAAAQRRIRELSLENQQLKQRDAYRSPSMSSISPLHPLSPVTYHTPGPASGTPVYFDSIGSSMYNSGYSGVSHSGGQGGGGYLEEETGVVQEGVDANAVYIAPRLLQADLLRGVYNFNDMRDVEIRPIVWVIAHVQPHNSMESASLKAAVSNLANRFSLGNSHPTCILLINAIFDWAKGLCFTSCGNYLCQQLLEKADMPDKQKFIDVIKDEIVNIAGDKFGTHVLCKAVAIKELEEPIADALMKYGVFDSLKTGARRLWREYLEKCRQNRSQDVFYKINEEMKGRWADLACSNEHGSIAVQQVFEVFGSQELTDPCFNEILDAISTVANNQFGHFLITKLLGYPHLVKPTCEAIIASYPPVAITHHGVNFVKISLSETARPGLSKYIDSICSSENGQTPGIVSIATASVGKAHLIFVLGYLSPLEQNRVRGVCKAYSTTLRNSQSGNDLLRSLGIIHAVGARYRAGTN